MSFSRSVHFSSAASQQTELLGLELAPPSSASLLAGGFNGSESDKKTFGIWVQSLSHHELMKVYSQIPSRIITEIAESAKSGKYVQIARRLELCASLQDPSIGALDPVKSVLLGYAPNSKLILFFNNLDDRTIKDICSHFAKWENREGLVLFNYFLSTLEIDERNSYFDDIEIRQFSGLVSRVVQENYTYVMKALTKSRKIDELPDGEYGYALRRAGDLGYSEIARAIINTSKFDRIDPAYIEAALWYFVPRGSKEIFSLIINSSKFKDISQNEIEKVFLRAAWNNQGDIFQALINSCQFNNIGLKSLEEALEMAASRNVIGILNILFECSRFNEIPIETIENALKTAASKGHARIFDAFIKRGIFDQISAKALGEILKSAVENFSVHDVNESQGISGTWIVDSIAASDKFNEIPLEDIEAALKIDKINSHRSPKPLSNLLIKKYELRKQSGIQPSDAKLQ